MRIEAISRRHGVHQLPQKLTNTTLPRRSESRTDRPLSETSTAFAIDAAEIDWASVRTATAATKSIGSKARMI